MSVSFALEPSAYAAISEHCDALSACAVEALNAAANEVLAYRVTCDPEAARGMIEWFSKYACTCEEDSVLRLSCLRMVATIVRALRAADRPTLAS